MWSIWVQKGFQFSCDHCEYESTRKDNLKQHIQAVHKGVRFSCDHCEYASTRKDNLKQHIKSVHYAMKLVVLNAIMNQHAKLI